MSLAFLHFYGELNTFLSASRKGKILPYMFKGTPSVKHVIEAMRVPHTEVGDIQVNSAWVDFSYLIKDGDLVCIFPALPPEGRYSQDERDQQHRFLLDNHLGKLAIYLRMSGFDTLYRNDFQDAELTNLACNEERILLTRDRGLLMRRVIKYGYCIRALEPRRQLIEVLKRFDLFDQIKPFKRCLRCNYLLQPISKESIIERLEPLTQQNYDEFHICSNCDQIYWKGSHYERMEMFLKAIREDCEEA